MILSLNRREALVPVNDRAAESARQPLAEVACLRCFLPFLSAQVDWQTDDDFSDLLLGLTGTGLALHALTVAVLALV